MTKLTGVGFVLCVGHESPEGVRHGHTYEGVAWYRFGPDARALQRQVDSIVKPICHTVLTNEISLGENLAEHIGKQLAGCLAIDLDRNPERLHARWEARRRDSDEGPRRLVRLGFLRTGKRGLKASHGYEHMNRS